MIDFKRLIDFYGEAGARFAFEDMCADLLSSKFPGTWQIRPNPGDKGIDCIKTDPSNGSSKVYQCKYFVNGIDDSQKEQIRDSYKSVSKYLGESLKEWILVLPSNMDTNEMEWFSGWKAKQSGVEIDFWGAVKLRPLLAEFSNIKDDYFRSDNSRVLKQIVSFQMELIKELRIGFDRIDARPRLKLMFLASDGCLSEEITISKRNPGKYKAFELKSESEIERICDSCDEFLDEHRIRKIMECYNSEVTPYMNKLNEETEAVAAYENPNFIMFAVLNEGEEPATNVSVGITFPSSLFVYLYSDLNELTERLPKPPNDPEKIILNVIESNCVINIPKLPVTFDDLALSNFISPVLDIASSPILKMLSDSLPGKIIVNSKDKFVQFGLGKVMHNGSPHHHDYGILIAPLEEGSFEVTYNIIADNIRSEVEGVLRITTSEDIESLEEWDPINE